MVQGAREYPPAAVFDAEDAFILDGLTLEQVSQKTSIPISTLKRWSSQKGWCAKREEYRRKESETRHKLVDARLKLITDCSQKGNPMSAFGYQALENATAKAKEIALKERAAQIPSDLEMVTDQASIAEALLNAISIKLGRLARDEKLDLKAVKDIQAALALAEKMKPKDELPEHQKGMSADFESTLRELLRK